MSTDSSGAIPGFADAGGNEHSPEGVSPRGLADIAAAIGRVATLIEADAGQAADGSDALERIADIAFVLHERDIEPSLCDALDTAVRELASAEAGKEANARRSRKAAESLRELARRLNDLAAPVRTERRAEPATAPSDDTRQSAAAGAEPGDGNDTVDEQMRHEELFASDGGEDDAFAQTVASLREALASFSEAAESGFNLQPHAPEIAVAPVGQAQDASPSVNSADDANALAPKSRDAVLLGRPSLPPTGEAVVADEILSGEESSADDKVPPLLETKETRALAAEPQALPGPDEDPGDLFEPAAHANPVKSGEPEAPVNAGTPPAATHPRRVDIPPPDDPLAPLLALSDEEMIALFG